MKLSLRLIFTCSYLFIWVSTNSLASGVHVVELKPQQHLNLLPAITLAHFSNNSGFMLRCENPYSSGGGLKVVKTVWKFCDNDGPNSIIRAVDSVLEVLHRGQMLLWHAFPEKSFRNDIHSNDIKCEHTFDGGGSISSHCIHIRAVIDTPITLSVSNKYPVKLGYPNILKCKVDEPSSDLENLLSIEGWKWNVTQKENQYAILPSGDLLLTTVSEKDNWIAFQCIGRLGTSDTSLITSPKQTLQRLMNLDEDDLASSTATFTEEKYPLIVVEWNLQEENGVSTIPCIGIPPGLNATTIQWFYYDSITKTDVGIRDTMGINDDGALRIQGPIREKYPQMLWQCRSKNTSISNHIWLNVTKNDQKGDPEMHTNAKGSAIVVEEVEQPKVVTASPRENVVFTCQTQNVSVGDYGDLQRIQWLYQGKLIEGQHGKVLNLDDIPSPHNNGFIQCIVMVKNQMVAMDVAKLEILEEEELLPLALPLSSTSIISSPKTQAQKGKQRLPYFIFVSPDRQLRLGGSGLLKCIAGGNPLPHITWILNGKVLKHEESPRSTLNNGSSTVVLPLESVLTSASGFYSCRAKNVFGEVVRTLRIDVEGVPFIREMTSPKQLVAGEPLAFLYCSYGGFPIDGITWNKDGDVLPTNERQIVFKNGTLVLKNISPFDNGNYTCSVHQGNWVAKQEVSVHVRVPPKIEPFNFPSKLQEGGRTRITCTALVGDLPIRFSWYYNHQILDSQDYSLSVVSPDAFTSSLSFSNLTTQHSGNYTCEARNAAAFHMHSAQLIVNVPPKWVSMPEDTHVRYGSTCYVKCQASGVPQPKIVWKRVVKDTANPHQSKFVDLPTAGPNYKLTSMGDLILSQANESHEGSYLCQAKNGIGSSGKSKLITIKVDVPPSFLNNAFLATQTAIIQDEDVSIKCEVQGDPPLHISWKRKGLDINVALNSQFTVEQEVWPGGLRSRLKLLHPAKREDSAAFECIATNEFGQNSTNINFVVQEVPEIPGNFDLVGHSSRQANLSWNLPYDGQSPLLAFQLEFQRTNAGYHDGPRLVKVPGNATWWHTTGLQPNSIYLVSLIAINDVGASRPSPRLRLTTDQEPPEGTATDIRAISNASQSILVTWKPPHPDLQHGSILSYSIGYRLANSSEPYRYVTVDARDPKTRLKWRIYEQLKTFTDYALVVQAFNRMGAGPKSKEIIVTTMEDVPSSPPMDVQCFATSSKSLFVSWNPPPREDRNGILQEYGVFYRPLVLWQEKVEVLEAHILDDKVTLNDLACYQNYSIRVAASTKAGDGLKSRSIYCRTKEDLPGSPSNIKALPVDRNSIMISWLPPEEPNGEILGYSLYMKTMERGRQFTQDFPLASHVHYYTMGGLNQGQPYSFWVSAFTLAGEGQVSVIVSETPQVSIPAGIASFSQKVTHAVKESVEMSCIMVGIPYPSLSWTKNGQTLTSRMKLQENGGRLILNGLELSDAANYSCFANNLYGQDSITYQLIVKLSRNNGVPPAPPSSLTLTSASKAIVTLHWPPSRVDGGSPVTTYRLHYHRQFGDWDRVDLSSNVSSYSLHGLKCGTVYQFFMEAINEFGVGDRTDTLTASTQGSPPIAPLSVSLALSSINSTSIDLDLGAWRSGGCDISSFVIEYRKINSGSLDWILVNNNVRPPDLIQDGLRSQKFVVLDLKPKTNYILRITAHNSAGSTVKEFSFTTLNSDGTPLASEGLKKDHHSEFVLPIVLVAFTITSIVLGIGLMLCMKKLEVKESLQLMNWPRNNIPSGEEIAPLPTSYHLPSRTTTTRLKCSGNEYELTATAAHTATTTPMHHDESYGFRGSLPLDVNDEDLKRTLGSNSVTLTRKHFNRGGSFYYDIAENPYATIQWHHHHHNQQQQQFHFGNNNPRLILPTRARGIQDGL